MPLFAPVALLLALQPPSAPPPATPARTADGGNLARLVTADDYPRPALRNEEQGTVAVRLEIDASGRVSGCTVTQSSGSPSLDTRTCEVLTERAHFIPARDSKGRGVADSYAQRITWRIAPPVPPPAPPPGGTQPPRTTGLITMEDYPADALRQHAQGLVRVALDIDENGRVTACKIVTSSGYPSLDAATCRILSTRARFTAAIDETGHPTKDVLTTQIDWRIPD